MPASTKPQSTTSNPRRAVSKPASDPNSNASHPRRNSPVSLSHHARKCAICKHPDRQAIDDDFINWRSHHAMAVEYQLPVRSSLYRHAEATGLLARRRRNLRGVAERILEQVADAPPSAASVLRALRIFTQITEDGQWVDPPKRSFVTHIHTHADSPAPDSASSTSPAPPNRDHRPNCHSEPAPTSSVGTTSLPAQAGNLQFDQSASRKRDLESPGAPSGVHSGAFSGASCAKGATATVAAPSRSDEPDSLPIARPIRAKSSAASSHSLVLSGVEGPLATSHYKADSEAHVAKPPARRAPRGVFYANNGFGPPCPDPLDDFLIATPNKTGEHSSD